MKDKNKELQYYFSLSIAIITRELCFEELEVLKTVSKFQKRECFKKGTLMHLCVFFFFFACFISCNSGNSREERTTKSNFAIQQLQALFCTMAIIFFLKG